MSFGGGGGGGGGGRGNGGRWTATARLRLAANGLASSTILPFLAPFIAISSYLEIVSIFL